MKGKVINRDYLEEEVVIDVNYMNDGAARMMLVDCGAPKSVVNRMDRRIFEGYEGR